MRSLQALLTITMAAAIGCSGADMPGSAESAWKFPSPYGSITVSPAHQIVAPGQLATSTVTWSTTFAPTAQVWVSQDGAPEQLFAQNPSGSQTAPWIQFPSRYVFKLYAGTAHTNLLAYTSVTTQSPDVDAGFDYWPQGYGPDALTDANWPTLRPVVAADLDQIASGGGGVLRLMLWPQLSGYKINGNLGGGYFTPELGQIARNLVEMVHMAAARNMAVIICFANNYFDAGNGTAGHRWWMDAYATFTPFLVDTRTWADTFVDALEASPDARSVIYYDYENEYTKDNPNMGWYVTFLYDWSTVPAGKRGISVLHIPDDLDDLKYQLAVGGGPEKGRRHLDYVDFHSYPLINYDTNLDATRSAVLARFPDSTVLLGEYGADTPDTSGEKTQAATVFGVWNLARRLVPMNLHWMLWDNTPAAPSGFGWGYDPDHPKDVLGVMAAARSLVANADFEQRDANGLPVHWSANGTVPVQLYAIGPQDSDAATGQFYGRVYIATAGAAWMVSDAQPVVPGKQLYVDAYVRTNLSWANIDVHEYDASMNELRVTSGPHITPVGWSWRNYLHAGGSFSVDMSPSTRYVIIAVAGQTGGELPGYIDVDAVTVAQR